MTVQALIDYLNQFVDEGEGHLPVTLNDDNPPEGPYVSLEFILQEGP